MSLRAIAPWVLALLALAVLPSVFTGRVATTLMNQAGITIIFALSYNMLLGQGGMLSFGHAIYAGLGGYAAIHLLTMTGAGGLSVPLPLVPLAGGLFALVLSALVGLFSLRRAGTSFAMISLGVGELIAASALILVAFSGGEEGLSADRTDAPFLGIDFAQGHEVYWIVAGWTFVSTLAMYLFTQTPAGRLANAVRDNPDRVAHLGFNPTAIRYRTFCVSGFFAGIAGGLFAITFEIVGPEGLTLTESGQILLATYLGGIGIFWGPILGAAVFTLLHSVVSLYSGLWLLYLGLAFVAAVLVCPRGLSGLITMHVGARDPVRLIRPYGMVLIPAAIAVLATIGLLELAHHHQLGALAPEQFVLFGLSFAPDGPLIWAACSVLLVAGTLLAHRAAPRAKQAFAAATAGAGP